MSTQVNVSPAALYGWLKTIVADIHKEASFVMGILAAMNVTPSGSATTNKYAAAILLGYSALTHVAGGLAGKSA